MTIHEAITIATEHNKWRRGEAPYDGPKDGEAFYPVPLPHSPEKVGKAIETLIAHAIAHATV